MINRTLIISLVFLTVLSACGSSGPPAVGTGAALSTLATQPSGVELYTAIETAVLAADTDRGGDRTLGTNNQRDVTCPLGGTIALSSTVDISTSGGVAQGGSLSGHASFTACKLTIELGGASYTETLDGSESTGYAASGGTLTNATDEIGLTIAGDLGLSQQCNTSTNGSAQNGSCIFRDSESTEITATAAELAPGGFIPILIADPFDI